MTVRTIPRRIGSRTDPTTDYCTRIVPERVAMFGNPHDPGSLAYRDWDDANFRRLLGEVEAREENGRVST